MMTDEERDLLKWLKSGEWESMVEIFIIRNLQLRPFRLSFATLMALKEKKLVETKHENGFTMIRITADGLKML